MPSDLKSNHADRNRAREDAQSFPAQREKLAAGLYLVATPIGNLRDITLRALDVLAGADRVYAEDTRQTGKLLAAYDIKASMTAYHDHNVAGRIPQILEQIESGEAIALVSDAGTPLVSDPGFKLARAAADAGLDIIPVPGASAALAGLLTSALPSDRFMFAGFLPAKSAARKTALTQLSDIPATLIFFEAGTRIDKTLADMRDVLGDRPAALARELTKTFEETRRGTLSELLTGVADDPPRGEIVLIIGGAQAQVWDDARIDAALRERLGDGVKRAAAEIATLSGRPKRDVYARAQALKDGRRP